MKKLILSSLILLSCTAVAEDKLQSCIDTGGLVEQIMLARQEGVSIGTMYEIAKQFEGVKEIVDHAYELPRYSAPENQRKAADDLRDAYIRACMSEE